MKYPFGLLSAIFLLWCVATPVIAQSPPGFPHDLDSESPVRAAQAVKHLQQLDRSSIGELANSLEADLSPRTRAYLESKLDSLLRGILEEFDTLGSELEELRKSPVSDETAVEKSLSRARIRNKFDSLLEIARTGGPFLATSLVWHSEIRDSSSELLKRMRSRIRTEILRSWSENHPGRDAASLTRSELRWLSVLSQKPISTVPEAFWQTVLERSCAEAWSDLCSFDPVRERRGRRYFLDIGPAAHDYFDSVLRNQKDGDPPTELIHEWRMRTLLRMPPEWDYSHAVSLADWKHKSGADRIEILLRLKAILGSKITPTLYHVATTATDPILRRRSAEFLSLLGDSRGAKILLTERRFGAHRLEAASRDAILRAATTLRDSKNLEGARLLLEELVERPSTRLLQLATHWASYCFGKEI